MTCSYRNPQCWNFRNLHIRTEKQFLQRCVPLRSHSNSAVLIERTLGQNLLGEKNDFLTTTVQKKPKELYYDRITVLLNTT